MDNATIKTEHIRLPKMMLAHSSTQDLRHQDTGWC